MTTATQTTAVSETPARVTTYVTQVEACVSSGRTSPMPDATLLRGPSPSGAIVSAEPATDEYGPRMDVVVRHAKGPRNPRMMDPWYYPAFILLDASGCPLRWHDEPQQAENMEKPKRYLRLMIRTPAGHKAKHGIPATRLIADTSAGIETRFLRGHHDLRRKALTFRNANRRPHPPKYGRAAILALATAEHRVLLERALAAADGMHELLCPTNSK